MVRREVSLSVSASITTPQMALIVTGGGDVQLLGRSKTGQKTNMVRKPTSAAV